MHELLPDCHVAITLHYDPDAKVTFAYVMISPTVSMELVYNDPDPIPIGSDVAIVPASTVRSVTTTATGTRWLSFITSGANDERLGKLLDNDIAGFFKLFGMTP